MTKLGEIAIAEDVGAPYGRRKVIWHACEKCAKERWVETRASQPVSRWCYPCGRRAGKPRGSLPREKSANWKGGRHVTSLGYIQVMVPMDDPLICMADTRGRVYEHRLVVARAIGRPLRSEEQVHHLNGNKADNRLSNLAVASLAEHAAAHRREVLTLRARVQELEHELRDAEAAAR